VAPARRGPGSRKGFLDRKHPTPREAGTGSRKARRSFAQHLKELFGKVAEAVTGKPTPALVARRKRREETKGGFMALARAVTVKIERGLFHFIYAPSVYDPEQERAYAEQVLREQMDEWTQEDEQEQDEAFNYASAAGFDLHP
jgi:hypothetical protein